MVAEESKKQKLNENEEYSEQVSGELVALIEKLQEVQDELDKMDEEANDKMLEIKQKYNEIRKPIYSKRNEAIEKIPDFWLTAFQGHPVLCELLTEEDQKIFKYLKSLDVSESKDVKSGYTITFNFQPNPYFENDKLTKVFTFDEEGNTTSTGTNINWKEGMKVTDNGASHIKKGNKKKRSLNKESFFTWFGEVDADDFYLVHDEVGNIINEDLWVNPLEYFNNEEEEEDDEDDDDDDENGDGKGNMDETESDGDDDDNDDENADD